MDLLQETAGQLLGMLRLTGVSEYQISSLQLSIPSKLLAGAYLNSVLKANIKARHRFIISLS